jgi:SHS2 domain-containing protein
MIELFDHTADLGLRIRAATLEELFSEAGKGFLSLLVVNPEAVRPVLTHRIELVADDVRWLLFDWLSELLFAFDTQKLLLCQFEITLNRQPDGPGPAPDVAVAKAADSAAGQRNPFSADGPWCLMATCRGELADPTRHAMDHEVKAITYHRLRVEQTPQGWEAEVIVDI